MQFTLRDVVNVIVSIWGILALFGGPILFFRARKYFPERKEAINPDQLRAELEKLDFSMREAVNSAIGRVQTAFEVQQAQLRKDLIEMKESMIEAHRKASAAHDEAKEANHKAELNQKDVHSLEKIMTERMDHLATLIKGHVR